MIHEVSPQVHRPLVVEYQSGAFNQDPLNYPGERPGDSFVTDGETVAQLLTNVTENGLNFEVETETGKIGIEDYLKSHGAEPMADRIPLIGYGANLCPSALLNKMGKAARADALVVPTLYVSLPGYDVVWSAGPGVNGNFVAELYQGPETANTIVQVGVNFLTKEQMLMMHATELSYDLRLIEVERDGYKFGAYFYAGKDSIRLDDDGKPIALATVKAEGREIESRTARKMSDNLLADPGVADSLRPEYGDLLPETEIDADGYIDFVRKLAASVPSQAKPRLQLKRAVAKYIESTGRSREVDMSKTGQLASWANPSTLNSFGKQADSDNSQQLFVLPEQELDINKWNADARSGVLKAIREHFHRHYPN